jgi:eukaryotic-like serine/threonine-protein kinase
MIATVVIRGRKCEHTIPGDAPGGICPRCTLAAILDDSPAASPIHEVGGYEIEELIAKGGMGVVYRARHKTLDRIVALKMLVGGIWADDDERARFRAEAELAASLEHENIVPIYEVGEHDGQPYYAMRMMQESLAAHIDRVGPLGNKQAATLVATVARAVHWGHLRGVVHRDLKPANILLDSTGRPFVGDFGVSRRLGQAPRHHRNTVAGALVGTPGYMAPEQAGGFGGDLTIAVDVWGLGAVLYELMCSEPPFCAESPAAFVRLLLDEDPVQLRNKPVGYSLDLETVCLTCLEKPPERRYASALDLALDLERVAAGEPIQARRSSAWQRALRFCRRYPARAGAAASAAVFVAALAVGSTLAARAQERELSDDTLHTNAWVARAVAGAVHFEMQKLADIVAEAAQDPTLQLALEASRVASFAPPLQQPFDSFLFLDERGICRGRWPANPQLIGRDLSFRNYFREASQQVRSQGVVSPAYLSEVDGTVRFAVSAPVWLAQRRVGVLVGSLASDSTLGALSLHQNDQGAGRNARTAILLARHGAERVADPRTDRTDRVGHDRDSEWLVLVHPALPASGAAVILPASALARMERTGFDPSYRDPIVGGEAFLAGMARVGDLPFAVVVATPTEHALAPNVRSTRRLLGTAGIALATGILVFFVSFAVARQPDRSG